MQEAWIIIWFRPLVNTEPSKTMYLEDVSSGGDCAVCVANRRSELIYVVVAWLSGQSWRHPSYDSKRMISFHKEYVLYKTNIFWKHPQPLQNPETPWILAAFHRITSKSAHHNLLLTLNHTIPSLARVWGHSLGSESTANHHHSEVYNKKAASPLPHQFFRDFFYNHCSSIGQIYLQLLNPNKTPTSS
jgi:hypothetical protein